MATPSTMDPELSHLLGLAAAEIRQKPNDVFMSPRFDMTYDLAASIEEAKGRLANGDVAAGNELYLIFLPTSDWDDAGGSQEMANRLCELLKPYFRSPKQ